VSSQDTKTARGKGLVCGEDSETRKEKRRVGSLVVVVVGGGGGSERNEREL